MEIQSDLIVLPTSNHLPLPWSVRGPLGLETNSEVSIALVHGGGSGDGLPDIVVTPLQSEFLNRTYTLDVELGERPGAVSDFLTWLGDGIAQKRGNDVNIVLSETITLEGRNKHKMHIVLEPSSEDSTINKTKINEIMDELKIAHADIIKYRTEPVYDAAAMNYMLEQTAPVQNGWIHYGDWKKTILERYPDAESVYDLSRMVVSSNPDQRLLRYIIPKKGVIELRVPHRNRPGALREISQVIGSQNFNILSSRLSRTPPLNRTAKTSVFVAACEPLDGNNQSSEENLERLRIRLRSIDTKYSIDTISISKGRAAEKTLFLTPNRRELVQIDPDIAVDRAKVREEIAARFIGKYNSYPKKFIFISKRFIDSGQTTKKHYDEQERSISVMVKAIEDGGCAVIEAANPGKDENRYYDIQVYKAVFSRLWASDACAVLALNEKGTGELSLSISHEIGFFSGRNRPIKVFTSSSRDKDPVFGNIVGMNRITYSDGDGAFVNDSVDSLYQCVRRWIESISRTS